MGYSIRSGNWRYTRWQRKNGELIARELYDHSRSDVATENVAELTENMSTVKQDWVNENTEGESVRMTMSPLQAIPGLADEKLVILDMRGVNIENTFVPRETDLWTTVQYSGGRVFGCVSEKPTSELWITWSSWCAAVWTRLLSWRVVDGKHEHISASEKRERDVLDHSH